MRQRFAARTAFCPYLALGDRIASLFAPREGDTQFARGVACEAVDRDNQWQAKRLDRLDMLLKVRHPALKCFNVFLSKLVERRTAVHLKRPHRGHDHSGLRREFSYSRFDIKEFLGAKVGPKARFGHHQLPQFKRHPGRQQTITAVRDVGKGTAVHQRGSTLKRLNQIGVECLFQQQR